MEFKHEVSEDGLTLVTTALTGNEATSGRLTMGWKTKELADQNIEAAKKRAEAKLSEELSKPVTKTNVVNRRQLLGGYWLYWGTLRDQFDNWLIRFGTLSFSPRGIERRTKEEKRGGEGLVFGIGGRKVARFFEVKKA